MPSRLKREKASSYQSRLNENPNFVLIGFERTTHKKMEDLRKEIKPLKKKDGKTDLEVIKNSLLTVALKKNKLESLVKPELYKGQTALLSLGGDWTEGLSVYYKFAKKEETLIFKGGLLDGKFYAKDELIKIAELPSKGELISIIVRSLKSSQTRIVFALKYPMMRLTNVMRQAKVN